MGMEEKHSRQRFPCVKRPGLSRVGPAGVGGGDRRGKGGGGRKIRERELGERGREHQWEGTRLQRASHVSLSTAFT